MSENFAGLDINGSFVREMRLGPKMVRLTLLRAPQSESETQVTRQYHLQFDGVRLSFQLGSSPVVGD